ncbi:MAG: glycoside hydrolase family 3 C-terminal domain-containing protein [Clostridia bacterium]|nr:glycoside hydrolase family 3 C-terminal domain-containing protein [Clostridia bacterium]
MRHSDLIRQLSLEEKCALLSGADVWHTHAIPRLNIPAMTLSDGPSGLRKQAAAGDHLGLNASTKASCIPSAATLANSWSIEAAEAMGEVVGTDAAAQDVQVLLGPGLNTKRSPLCGRSFEYYSEDPYLAGKMAAGFIRGVQRMGVNACAKHFCANSQELLRMHSDSVVDERTLRELYLTNFEIAVREGKPGAVMTSYNRLNGTYTNEDQHLLSDVLRGEWGFDGMVVTDWGGSNSYTAGVRAGMCLEMPAAGDDSPCQLLAALKQGEIDEAAIDQRVDELLSIILARRPAGVTTDPASQHEAIRKAAEMSIVLLKNEGLLPLDPQAKVAVIGDFAGVPRYQGAGSSMVNAERIETVEALLPGYFPNCVGYAPGFERLDVPNAALTDAALVLARQADVVLLCLGLPEGFETEGLDRTHMRLPQNQIDLLAKVAAINPNIVVTLSAGSAVEMPWAEQCKAIVFGALGGQAAASAMLNVLTGKVNPGGKLSETFPLAYSDMPVSRYYPGTEATAEYREGLYVGYRYFTTAEKPVRFPFGHGLSYTTFAYSDLALTDAAATFTLENTGKVDGDEVVQLYVTLPGAKVFRPAMELKGFARVHLRAGEKKQVAIPFDEYTFRYFNVKTGKYEVETGDYEIRIAASSEDIRLRGSLHVAGTDAPAPYADDAIRPYLTGDVLTIPDEAFEALLGHKRPAAKWDRTAPLDMNDAICQMAYAKNPLCRLAAKILGNMIDSAVRKGKPDLNLLFIYNMPFRGMAKMMGGMISTAMAEDICFIANGHFFRGAGRLARHFFTRPKLTNK